MPLSAMESDDDSPVVLSARRGRRRPPATTGSPARSPARSCKYVHTLMLLLQLFVLNAQLRALISSLPHCLMSACARMELQARTEYTG